ncbi:peptidoglycan D,D-transpeptidase FtsI family protein [Altericroceibacterium endophyticum]|uniref:Penicillin-binding protein 2 n=1 Tax=Altericroceibacterium endophyticum TaxID=1808508 RepID=A0A6I4T880_9SPHN|nr:penicillin-binding protein 2 [Altericroceibacterium endophyticum]MXO66462.1 penicillin-binding protein 2 [Altericroceibacterium endophyticum]
MTSLTASGALASGRVRLVNIRERLLLTARLRVLLIIVCFLALALAALLRIAWIGLVQPTPSEQSMAEALLPSRGEITDRNGVPLARAFPAYALWYNPKALGDGGSPLVKSPRVVAQQLAAIFPGMDVDDIAERLEAGKAGYLRRRVLPEEANRVHDIGELALELPRESDRHYPQGSMAAHVLGYVAADGHGRVGMESVLDDQLLDPATRGTPTPLSIDMRVQGALEDELRRGMLAVDALGAAGIVLDVDTGEVLALASLPEFDPNKIDEQGEKLMFNRVTNQVYELGSTFKPLTVAAAIDAGVVTDLSRRYQANRPLKVGGFQIRDSHTIGASLNVPETLIHSSNIVTAQIADELGAKRLKRTMADLGMNERPYIELPARGFPIWPKGEWRRLRAMTVSYGHGIAVTPLHLASAYATMVNGGIWRPATLRKVAPGAAPRGRRVFKASTSARMNQLLRMIAVYGTGRNADAPGFRVGGKTGSAEKPGANGYRHHTLVSTFAAAFPMDKPRYVIIAMLDEPKGTAASSYQRTAAWNAAPIVGKLVPRIGPLLGVTPDSTHDIDLTDLKPLVKGDE